MHAKSESKMDAIVHHVRYEPVQFSDLMIAIDNLHFHVHKSLLCLRSKVWQSILATDNKESHHLDLSGHQHHQPDNFKVFMDNMYELPTSNSITRDNVKAILQLANYYNVDAVKRQCMTVFQESKSPFEDLALACECGVPSEMQDFLLDQIMRDPATILQNIPTDRQVLLFRKLSAEIMQKWMQRMVRVPSIGPLGPMPAIRAIGPKSTWEPSKWFYITALGCNVCLCTILAIDVVRWLRK
jgi:hypothetical protein